MEKGQRENDGVDVAFSMLLEELKACLQRIHDAGARAFTQGYYTEIDRLKEQAERVRALIARAEVLEEDWAKVKNEHPPAITSKIKETEMVPGSTFRAGLSLPPIPPQSHPRKLAPGQRTPEEVYVIPILKALEEMGGQGRVSNILDRVLEQVRDRLTESDYGQLRSGEIRWRNAAQWARHTMVTSGLLSKDSPRGIWEITPQGREYLARHRALAGDSA